MDGEKNKIRVGILKGGISPEYNISLSAGQNIFTNLNEEKYQIIDILVDRSGQWHLNGLPVLPDQVFNQVDVILNALYGEYGEDGKVQHILETFSMPYVGSGVFPSAVTANKFLAKEYFRQQLSIQSPLSEIIDGQLNIEEQVLNIFRKMSGPWIIKPLSGGSSLGVSLARSFQELVSGVTKSLQYSNSILVEEYIEGREITTGIITNFRGEKYYIFSPMEVLKKGEILNYEAKIQGDFELSLLKLDSETKKEIKQIVLDLSRELNLSGYADFKFILSPRGLYLIEINSLPKLYSDSIFNQILDHLGTKETDFLDHLINDALQ